MAIGWRQLGLAWTCIAACAPVLVLALAAPREARADAPAAQRLTVLAAASLTESFKAIGRAFAQAHPGLTIEFSFAGSSTLATQINEGAPADVFASADEANMQKVADGGELADAPRVFATNRLAIVVPRGNPKHITSLADLAGSGIVLALAAPAVPAGKYAALVLARAGVTVTAASQEMDVRAVLTKVALDEADAGLVYLTDVDAAPGKVEAVAIPPEHNVVARYPIAVLRQAGDRELATAFVNFVLAAPGQTTLRELGFLAP